MYILVDSERLPRVHCFILCESVLRYVLTLSSLQNAIGVETQGDVAAWNKRVEYME